jgi:septal ring-binding cell division protein DamX
VSAVETPPTGRQCPRCGSALTEEQEWCLQCGAATGTRVVAAPGWRVPIVVACLILALSAIAVGVAIVTLADDTNQVTDPQAAAVGAAPTVTGTTTPVPSATPEASPSAEPSGTPEPAATPTPTSGTGASGLATWPAGQSGYTIVLSSDSTHSAAVQKGQDFAAQGIPGVGVLNSDNFSSLKPGFFVVFSGVYDSESEAGDALDGVPAKDAYVRRIVPN